MRKLVVLIVVAGLVAPGGARGDTTPGCDQPFAPAIGVVATHTCVSQALHGETTFSYFVPEACADGCPSLTLLHGFGGDHQSMLGTASSPSSFVRGLSEDPVTGDDLDDLDLILIAPSGRTVETTGPNPAPAGLEGFWVNWNPRYTDPAPRFEDFVVHELRALAVSALRADPDVRGIDGVSLGGFGSFKLALQHPEKFYAAGSISGALNILIAPGAPPSGAPGNEALGWPGAPATVRPERVITTPPGFPFGDPFRAFGDPIADEAYFRGNNPVDLAMNAGRSRLRFFHNDTVTRDPAADLANPASFLAAFALEAAVLPMNLEMLQALETYATAGDAEYSLHPGLHSGRYWDPYIRAQLEWHDTAIRTPPAPGGVFGYRSIARAFTIGGWDVEVLDRPTTEFLTVSGGHSHLGLSGSGRIRVTSPPGWNGAEVGFAGLGSGQVHSIGSAVDRVTVELTLGPSMPVDERAAAGRATTASHEASIHLT